MGWVSNPELPGVAPEAVMRWGVKVRPTASSVRVKAEEAEAFVHFTPRMAGLCAGARACAP